MKARDRKLARRRAEAHAAWQYEATAKAFHAVLVGLRRSDTLTRLRATRRILAGWALVLLVLAALTGAAVTNAVWLWVR